MAQRRQLSHAQRQVMGANLVEARTKAGIPTAVVAAKKAGMTGPRLSLWETGQITPELGGLMRLSVLYRCPIDSFLSGMDERYDNIIESEISIDVRRHYKAQQELFIQETTRALELAVAGRGLGPMPTTTAASAPTTNGKSAQVRVRRKPGK